MGSKRTDVLVPPIPKLDQPSEELEGIFQSQSVKETTRQGRPSTRDKLLIAIGYNAGRSIADRAAARTSRRQATAFTTAAAVAGNRPQTIIVDRNGAPESDSKAKSPWAAFGWANVYIVGGVLAAGFAAMQTHEVSSWRGVAASWKANADANHQSMTLVQDQYNRLQTDYSAILSQLIELTKTPSIDPKAAAALIAELLKHTGNATVKHSDETHAPGGSSSSGATAKSVDTATIKKAAQS